MAKAVRFPRKMEVWVPDSIADAFELLAADQLLSTSDHMRQAFRLYLTQLGMMPSRPVNGHAHQPRAEA